MNPELEVIEVTDFTGGLNLESDALLEDNEFTELVNAEFTAGGKIRSRPGIKHEFNTELNWYSPGAFTGPPPNFYLGTHRFPGPSATQGDLVHVFASHIVDEDGVILHQSGNATFVGVGFQDMFAIPYADELYVMGNAVPQTFKYSYDTGTLTYSDDTVEATGKSVAAVFKDRLFYVNSSGGEIYRLWFSEIGDLGNTDPTSFIDVENGDGSEITALIPFNDTLVIFKRNSIHTLYANGLPANWNLRLFDKSVGTLNRRSVAIQSNMMFFIDTFGIYTTDGVSIKAIGKKITDELLSRSNGLTDGYAVNYKNGILFNISYEDENKTFLFNIDQDGWAEWDVPSEIQRLSLDRGTYYFPAIEYVPQDAFPDREDSHVTMWKLDNSYGYDDFGAEDSPEQFYVKIRSKFYELGSSFRYKNIRFAFIELIAGTLLYRIHPDEYDAALVETEVSVLDDEENPTARFIKLVCPSRVRRISFECRILAHRLTSNVQAKLLNFGFVYSTEAILVSDGRDPAA